jgi:hypothetical protein
MTMQDPIQNVINYQRDLFCRLDEFFSRATGKSATDFSTIDDFGDVVRGSAHQLLPRSKAAFQWLDDNLRPFYASEASEAFSAARKLGGMKLVLGGSSRFHDGHLASVSTSVLYSDTVLIPDPVLPWLEKERTEEKFRHVLLLQAVHALLHLKPLVDIDLQYPAVLVFPSWEKILEDNDEYTQEALSQLIADVFSNFLGENLESFSDVKEYADRNPERFLKGVDSNRLFIASDGPLDERLADALARHKTAMSTWRSKEWMEFYTNLPTHLRVLNAVAERIGPIYHLLENAEEMGGHPLLCIEQQAHYYKLISATNSARLERLGLIDQRTKVLVDALGSRRLSWLGDLSVEALTRLRKDNENVAFRNRLYDSLGNLHQSMLGNVDKVAAEICHELASAIADYEKQQRSIQEKYNRIHGQTAVLAGAVAGAALIPALAPFLGVAAPFALAAKYGRDKVSELAEKRGLTKSLVGVLAAVKSKDS